MSKPGQKSGKAASGHDHSAVTFPAGSFDHTALHETLDKAAAAPDAEKRQALIDEATVAGNQTPIGVVEADDQAPATDPPVDPAPDKGAATSDPAQD